MQNRRLGRGPLEVSELSFGTWLTVGGGIGREQAIRCVGVTLPAEALEGIDRGLGSAVAWE